MALLLLTMFAVGLFSLTDLDRSSLSNTNDFLLLLLDVFPFVVEGKIISEFNSLLFLGLPFLTFVIVIIASLMLEYLISSVTVFLLPPELFLGIGFLYPLVLILFGWPLSIAEKVFTVTVYISGILGLVEICSLLAWGESLLQALWPKNTAEKAR